MEVPYPLSTSPSCGDPSYRLICDPRAHKLYLAALNRSSYLVLKIEPAMKRLVVQPAPWLPGNSAACVTEDMPSSEGLWLNQSLPFNITASNTVFLLNCSPRLLLSPLNCTISSLCHRYLQGSRMLDPQRAAACGGGPGPCCTFVAGGMPSAYKIRLHASGCRAFRSVIHLDPQKPPAEWEEGLEIQWAPPPEPPCDSHFDCPLYSFCSRSSRCLCSNGYVWNPTTVSCSKVSHNHHSHHSIKIMVGTVGSCLLASLTAAIAITIRCYKLYNKNKIAKKREEMLKNSVMMFGWKELKKATEGFSKMRLLGSGGFGEVYKGILDDGTIVAVKSAKVGNLKSTQQVLNEVQILSLVNHKHLVRLLGCCVEAEQPLMVYEYIPNGTLHDHLHGRGGGGASELHWRTRLKIAWQTAEALAYLHSAAQTPIYHRDIKSTNILLDNEMNAKVSDFGLSRLAQPGISHVSTCAQGTLGYLDPEYYKNYQLTDKSDVYSFGVVLLELVTSQKVIDFSRNSDDVNLAVYVLRRAGEIASMDVVDKRLFGGDNCDGLLRSVEMFVELAMGCLREKKEERPPMKEVAKMLQCIIEVEAHQGCGDNSNSAEIDTQVS